MFLNTREKTLATILGAAVVAASGYSLLESQVLQPLDAANAKVSAARLRNANLQAEFASVEHAQRYLRDVAGQSLPEDPSVASVMYQEWLLRRSNEAGFESPLIIPGSPIPVDDVGYRIPFTLQTSAGLRQIGKFFDSFHRSDLIHRISYVSISSESRSSSQRRLNINIEALALEGAPTPESLPRPGPRRIGDRPLGDLFARNDPFRRAVVRKVSEPVLTAKKAADDKKPTEKPNTASAKRTIRFVAAISSSGVPQAWFLDESTGKGFVRVVGEELRLKGEVVSISSVTEDSISFAGDDAVRTVRLGQQL